MLEGAIVEAGGIEQPVFTLKMQVAADALHTMLAMQGGAAWKALADQIGQGPVEALIAWLVGEREAVLRTEGEALIARADEVRESREAAAGAGWETVTSERSVSDG